MYSSPPLIPQARKILQAGEDGIEMGGIYKIIDGVAPGKEAIGSVSQAKQEFQGALHHLRPEAAVPFLRVWHDYARNLGRQSRAHKCLSEIFMPQHGTWHEKNMAPRCGERLDLRGQVNRSKGLKTGTEGRVDSFAETRVAPTPRTKALPTSHPFSRLPVPSADHRYHLREKASHNLRLMEATFQSWMKSPEMVVERLPERLPGGRRRIWDPDRAGMSPLAKCCLFSLLPIPIY